MTEWSNDVDDVKGGSFTNVVDLEMEDCTMSYDGIKLSSNAFKKVPKGTMFKNSPDFQRWFDERM